MDYLRVFQLNDFPRKMVQRIILRDAAKSQPLGAKSLRGETGTLIHFAVPILEISQNRVTQIGQMRPDLMRASCNQSDAAQRKRAILADDRHIGDDFFVPLRFVSVDTHLVVFFAVL